MKYAMLVPSLLLSFQISAGAFEAAQRELAEKSARVEAAEKKVEQLRNRSEKGHQLTTSIANQHEYADDMEKRKSRVRGDIEAHNRAVEEQGKELEELKKCIRKHGRKWQIQTVGNRYELVRGERRAMEPIVTRSRETATAMRPVVRRRVS